MKIVQIFGWIVLSISLAACASLFGHQNDYRNSQVIKPIVVPRGLSSSKIHSYYPRPIVQPAHKQKSIDLVPPGNQAE